MEVMTATHPSGVARHHFLMANGAIFCYQRFQPAIIQCYFNTILGLQLR